jgi:hypothetical protein
LLHLQPDAEQAIVISNAQGAAIKGGGGQVQQNEHSALGTLVAVD